MPKKYYAVAKGRKIGVFTTWEETKGYVDGYSEAKYKSFPTELEAFDWVGSFQVVSESEPRALSLTGAAVRKRPRDADDQFSSTSWPSSHGLEASVDMTLRNNSGLTQPSMRHSIRQVKTETLLGLASSNTQTIRVTFDGSCWGNGRRSSVGGFGVHIHNHPEFDIASPIPSFERQTNNRAELRGALAGIKIASRHFPGTHVVVEGDSKYVVTGVNEWRHVWKKNGWKTAGGAPVEHQDLWEDLENALEDHRAAGGSLTFGYIPREQNSIADALANTGTGKARGF